MDLINNDQTQDILRNHSWIRDRVRSFRILTRRRFNNNQTIAVHLEL